MPQTFIVYALTIMFLFVFLTTFRKFNVIIFPSVVELDKNVGVGVISKNLYNKLCLEFLSNPDGYEKIEHDPFLNSCSTINDILLNLFINKNLSKKLYKKLTINHLKCNCMLK